MARERKIIGIWPAGQTGDIVDGAAGHPAVSAETHEAAHEEPLLLDDPVEPALAPEPVYALGEPDSHWLESPDVEPRSPSVLWLVATLAAIIGWGVWTAWLASSGFTALPQPAAIYGHVSQFLVPAALVFLVWLIGAYVGGRGAARHLRLLGTVRAEQQQLDNRLTAIGQHWLEAHDRLVARSHGMAEEMLTASSTLDAISKTVDERMRAAVVAAGEVFDHGQAARRHMEGLILALPKVDETARRMADTIKAAGQSAYQYGGQLEERMAQLRAEMSEAETVATSVNDAVASKVAELRGAVTAVDGAAMQAGDRFASTLAKQRDAALSLLVELAASLETHAAQTESRFNGVRSALADSGVAQLDAIDERVRRATQAAGTLHERLDTTASAAASIDSHLATLMRQAVERLTAIEAQAAASRAGFADLADGIETSADAIERRIAEVSQATIEHVGRAADIQQSLQQVTEAAGAQLPAALASLQQAQRDGQATLDETAMRLEQQVAAAAEMQSRVDASGMSLERHASLLQSIHGKAAALGQQQQTDIDVLAARVAELRAALGGEIEHWTGAVETARQELVGAADAHGHQLSKSIDQALARATGPDIEARLAAIAEAAVAAVARAEELSVRLAQQVDAIEQSSATLAERIATTQLQVDGQSSDTLARLVARTNEALQSTAVDLTRLLSADVSDQAWEAYLKGDRGVFARRAVRLLNNAEARDVLARYQNDDDFRGLVNRYIHDFEGILRNVMDTRDGAALSVTLLSSDIGKVYVALAQAIERLRN